MSMDRKQKRLLRQMRIAYMDLKTPEGYRMAREITKELENDTKIKKIQGGKRLRTVTLIDKRGNTKTYKSISDCARAFNVTRGTVLWAIDMGTPETGVFEGCVISLNGEAAKPKKKGRRVLARSPEGEELVFDSVSEVLETLEISSGAFYRSVKLKLPISNGKYEGWRFEKC